MNNLIEASNPFEYVNPLKVLEAKLSLDKILTTSTILQVITPKVEPIGMFPSGEEILRHLEAAIRTAYKSEDKIGPDSHNKILKHILSLKHESTLEHVALSFRITTCRGVTHELVRHRVGTGYTQESTRYVNYGEEGKQAPKMIVPWHLVFRSNEDKQLWLTAQETSIQNYNDMLKRGWKPQDARGILSNDLKTEIVVTMNIRAWRHFIELRTEPSAHPDIQVVAREVHRQLYDLVPVLFQDYQEKINKRIL